jgi:hypothetical protein
MATREPSSTDSIFQLKLTLNHIKPEIWRRLLVPTEVTLAELHFIINEVMGWDCSHAHSFSIGKRTFGDPELDPDNELRHESEREIALASVVDVGTKFSYTYDFGDDWEHEVNVEKQLAVDEHITYPVCIGGARACPPEDCHGPQGYSIFLEAIGNPKHPEHDEMRSWIGGYFDPEGFDPNRTNASLRAMYECTDCEGCDDESCDCDHGKS